MRPTLRSFTSLSGKLIDVIGTAIFNIKIAPLADRALEAEFYVVNTDNIGTEIIIGRDLLVKNKLSFIFQPVETKSYEIEDHFMQKLLRIEPVPKPTIEEIIRASSIDQSTEVKIKLINLIKKIENDQLPQAEDDYCVQVFLKDTSTFAFAPRKFAFKEREQLRSITDDLLKRGIIKPSISPYCSRVVPVRKKDGSLRLCVDLRPLNSRVNKQKYPFPLIEDCLSRLAGKTVFTLLDLKDGFHQIKLHPDSTKFFSFATPDGQFEYNRLPFGYCEAPAEFQKRIIQVLQPLIREDKVIVYIDDILIPSNTVDANLDTIKEILTILKQHGFTLNYSKCEFLKSSIEFLGYIISEQGITMSERHTEAVRTFPQPRNIHEVRSFLGLSSYFRKFIKNHAIKAKPLTELLKKSTIFQFNDSCKKAFESLKQELVSYPVLRHFNPSAETELHTDASSQGFGAILIQKQPDALWAPIAYYSQLTNQAEQKYHSFELEMMAIVKAIQRFHIYLYGMTFTVITDCNAIVHAVNKANLNPRIARWTLQLQNYSFKIAHRVGKRMAHVDALSRRAFYVDSFPIERELEFRQLQDSSIQKIANQLEFSDDERFELIDGLVYRKHSDSSRFVLPESMVNNVIAIHHDQMSHCGAEKTYLGISHAYWFPSMRKRIRAYIENCVTCLMTNSSRNSSEGELQFSQVSYPLEVLHIDHFGPLQPTVDGYKHILVVIDAFTRFTWLFPTRSTSSKEVCRNLQTIFDTFGAPTVLVSDRGTAFTSDEFAQFVHKFKVRHQKVAVASPWANGLAERANRFLKSSLAKMIDGIELWKEQLGKLQYVINNSHHKAIKASPSKVMLGYEHRNHADHALSTLVKSLAEADIEVELERDNAREIAADATDKIKHYNKIYYDKKHKSPSKYSEGNFVLVRDLQPKPGINRKLTPKYKGPYIIAKVLNKNRYVVQDVPGFNITSKPFNTIMSSDKLKLWVKPADSEANTKEQ